MLVRNGGWDKHTLKPGDVITAIGFRAKNGTNILRLKKIVLSDGKELWKQGRSSNLYIGCVHDGKVILIGRDHVSAVKLGDGTPGWKKPASSPATRWRRSAASAIRRARPSSTERW